MRIYLAGATSRAPELRRYAEALRKYEHTIVSQWHESDPAVAELSLPRLAQRDLGNLMSATCVICFSSWPPLRSNNDTDECEELVEFGSAIALNKRVILIGPRVNHYCDLDEIDRYNDFESFITSVFVASGPES